MSLFQRSSFSTPSIAYATNIVLPTVFATISAMVLVTALRFACIKYRKRKSLQQEQCMAMGDIRINDGKNFTCNAAIQHVTKCGC
jgi:hypothetical protein